jgi:dCMP deaminase
MLMSTRSNKFLYYFEMAKACARRSTCLRRKVGAVLVDPYGTIVSTGYNGAPSGEMDCLERGFCWRDEHDIGHGEHYEKCHAVHAEANAIIQAGKQARYCTMYIYSEDENGVVVNYPCLMCSRLMINAGIKEAMVYNPKMVWNFEYVWIQDYYMNLCDKMMPDD